MAVGLIVGTHLVEFQQLSLIIIEITIPPSARNASDQGWLLCPQVRAVTIVDVIVVVGLVAVGHCCQNHHPSLPGMHPTTGWLLCPRVLAITVFVVIVVVVVVAKDPCAGEPLLPLLYLLWPPPPTFPLLGFLGILDGMTICHRVFHDFYDVR